MNFSKQLFRLVFCVMFLTTPALFAQVNVTGTVLSSDQTPLEGCEVSMLNTQVTATTSAQGVFSLIGSSNISNPSHNTPFPYFSGRILNFQTATGGQTVNIGWYDIKGELLAPVQTYRPQKGKHQVDPFLNFKPRGQGMYMLKVKVSGRETVFKVPWFNGAPVLKSTLVPVPGESELAKKSSAVDEVHILCRGYLLKTIDIDDYTSPLGNISLKKPNVLFFSIDDLNDYTNTLHGYRPGGKSVVLTPNLDRIAAGGTEFTNAHTNSPTCLSARAAVMTGIRTATSGVYRNQNDPWRDNKVLKDATTVSRYFANNGYKAMGAGKIYHPPNPDPESWDYFWPSMSNAMPGSPSLPSEADGIPGNPNWGPLPNSNEEMGDWKVADWVIGELQATHDKPFFLACGIFRPHGPMYVPQEWYDMYPLSEVELSDDIKPGLDDDDDIPGSGRNMFNNEDYLKLIEADKLLEYTQGYLASVRFADSCVGRVLDALESGEYSDNTIIVVWSDHGYHLGGKNRIHKWDLWEEATRSVMMISARGYSVPGGRVAAPANLLDIYPTLIELAGLPVKPELSGVNMVPWMQNPELEREEPSLITHMPNSHALRGKRWKYIRYASGDEELYDHENDPHEWNNLAGDPQYQYVKDDMQKWFPTDNVPEDPPPK